MAITEIVRDLENYPIKIKYVTLDLQKVVPIDNEGDEVYVLSVSGGTGSFTSKIDGTTILPIFVRDYKCGYFKSSGFKNGPFVVASGTDTFSISIDGSTYHDITLAHGTGLTGNDIAADMESKITALAASGAAEAGNLEFLNATVDFIENRFWFVAGSLSNTYTGIGKSSVLVSSGSSNNCTSLLGLDLGVSSEALSAKVPVETQVSISYSGGGTLNVLATTDLAAYNAFSIYDGVNRDYFVASGIDVGVIGILGSGLNHNYATGAVVQKIFERDPSGSLASPYENVDGLTRFLVRSIANQINFAI